MTLLMRDQENIEKGIKIGKAKGKIEGKAEGKVEGKAELIYVMFKNGLTMEQIEQMCNMTKEEVEALMNQAKVIGEEKGL